MHQTPTNTLLVAYYRIFTYSYAEAVISPVGMIYGYFKVGSGISRVNKGRRNNIDTQGTDQHTSAK